MGNIITIIIVISIIPLGIFFNKIFSIFSSNSTTGGAKLKIENPDDTINSVRKNFTKAEIEEKLRKLANKPLPKNLAIGAMCYEMAVVKHFAEYTCPICGEKTYYSTTQDSYIPEYIKETRNLIQKLPSEQFQLDESELCKKCHPDIQRPQICLIVKYNNNEQKKTCPISSIDLEVAYEFLNDKNVHRANNGAEEPLKEYLEKLEEIFDIKLK